MKVILHLSQSNFDMGAVIYHHILFFYLLFIVFIRCCHFQQIVNDIFIKTQTNNLPENIENIPGGNELNETCFGEQINSHSPSVNSVTVIFDYKDSCLATSLSK